MTMIEVEAVVAGTRPMDAYGGVQLDRAVLVQLANALRSGQLPFILQHDPTRPLSARILEAVVEDDGAGYEHVRIRFEIEAGIWKSVEDEWRAAGARGGFSWSGSSPLAFVPALGDSPKPTVDIAADAHFWTSEQILAAATELSREANVRAAERFAFAHAPDPVVVVTLYEIARDVFAAALWDALKSFFARAATVAAASPDATIFEFRVVESGREVIGRVATSDPEVLRHAIDALSDLPDESSAAVWNEQLDWWETRSTLPPAPVEPD